MQQSNFMQVARGFFELTSNASPTRKQRPNGQGHPSGRPGRSRERSHIPKAGRGAHTASPGKSRLSAPLTANPLGENLATRTAFRTPQDPSPAARRAAGWGRGQGGRGARLTAAGSGAPRNPTLTGPSANSAPG